MMLIETHRQRKICMDHKEGMEDFLNQIGTFCNKDSLNFPVFLKSKHFLEIISLSCSETIQNT